MISAGEIGGILDTILQRLAIYMEKAMKLKAKIKGAMIYPATIITAAVASPPSCSSGSFRSSPSCSSFGQALPAPTQFVINLSDFTIAYFSYIIGCRHRRRDPLRPIYKTERGAVRSTARSCRLRCSAT